jgi:hypothetical protein
VTEDGVTDDDATDDGATPGDVPAGRLDRRQLLNLLVMWSAAVLLPGIIAIPWAGRGLEEFQIPAYLLWGLGFLIQLFVFTAIAKVSETTQMWAWLFTSVVPWVINLTVPDNPQYIPVFVIAVGVFAAWIFLRSSATDRLLHDGLDGTGVVLEVIEPKAINAVVNNGYVRRSVRVTVERADKMKTYEAVVRDLFKVEELPSPGDRIPLRIDPEDAKRVVMVPAAKPAPEAPSTPVDESADEPADESGEGETSETS